MPTVHLTSWDVECVMFEGDSVAGPVMSLFAEDPGVSKQGIDSNQAWAYADYQKIVRCFLMPELVSGEEAIQIVKKPR